MSTRTKPPKTWLSGFCNPSNPPDSHRRCDEHPRDDGTPCSCLCHMAPNPDIPTKASALGETRIELVSEVEAAESLNLSCFITGSIPADDPTGFHPHIDEDDYHAHPTSLSVSGAKLILKAPALYLYRRTHPEQNRVFDFGRAAHAKVLGVGSEIVVIQRTVTNRKGEVLDVVDATDLRSASAQEHQQQIRDEGKTPLLRSELDRVDAMAAALADVPLVQQLMRDGEPEVSAFCEDAETGIMRRSRFDLLDDLLVDYKTTVDAEPYAFARSAAKYGYHQQHAWYEQIAVDLGRKVRGFVFVAQEKTPPYLTSVTELDADAVTRGAELNRRALEMFRDCTESGRWPGYGDQIIPISLPRYALYDQQEPA